MILSQWLPVIRPPKSVQSVLRELIKGLKDGSIVLQKRSAQDVTSGAPKPSHDKQFILIYPRIPDLLRSQVPLKQVKTNECPNTLLEGGMTVLVSELNVNAWKEEDSYASI